MMYAFFSGKFGLWECFDLFTTIFSSRISLPFSLFNNFVSNIRAVVGGGSVWSIVSMLPDFAFMIMQYIPATAFISNVWPIAKLL